MLPTWVGQRIREFRILRGLSQSQLAYKINLSYQQLQKYESGRSQITLNRLYQISQALDVPVSAFLPEEKQFKVAQGGGEYIKNDRILLKVSKEEAILVSSYRKMEKKEIRECLLSLMKSIIELSEDQQ